VGENYHYSWINKNADNTAGPGKVKTYNYAVYLQDELRFFKNKLNFVLGARLDKYENINVEFSPRAAVVIMPFKNLTLKTLGGTAFKPPTFRQTHQVRKDGKSPGNLKVEPERIATFESEVSYRMFESLLININYFNNSLEDFIESIDYGPYSNNDDEINISGVESEMRIETRLKSKFLSHLSFFLNYTYTSARIDSSGFESDVSNVAGHSANLGLTLRNKWLSLFNGFNYLGERNKSRSWRTTDYLIWDINVRSGKIAGLPVGFELSVHNVMDQRHYNPTYDPDWHFPYTKETRNIGVKAFTHF
jgi:outer membrane receptor for ferrienterochelin and colicin